MSDNWVVQNLQSTLGTWNEKLAEIWTLLRIFMESLAFLTESQKTEPRADRHLYLSMKFISCFSTPIRPTFSLVCGIGCVNTARIMLVNSEFLIMLGQAPADKYELA